MQATDEVIPDDIKKTLSYGALTCKPRIMIFIEGEKKEEIDGADFTKVAAAVAKYIPSVEE